MKNTWGFDLTSFDEVWKIILQVVLILGFLLIGNILRRKISFLRKAFIPSALLGGILLFVVNILIGLTGFELVDKRIMQIITYHTLAIGFIASSLKIIDNGKKKAPVFESIQNGAITGGTYMLQAVCGITVSVIFYAVTSTFFYDAGMLLPLGFGQGPGSALTWDVNFSNMSNSFKGNGSVGLTIASIGFVVASIVGIIYMNIFAKKGEIQHREENITRDLSKYEVENEIKDTDSVDKMSIQFALVAVCFAMAFGIMFFFAKLSEWTGVALFNSVAWGFNFIWGVIAASLVKPVIKFLEKKKIMKHRYINNYQMDRISGFAFDLMIIAGVAAIDVETVGNYIWFILIVCAVGTIVTIIYVRLMTKLVFKDIQHEAFLINFGTLTGTASNGMILLREVDPNGETPMSNIFIISQLPAMVFVAPLLLLTSMSAGSLIKCLIVLGIFGLLFILYTIFLILSAKGIIFKKKNPAKEQD